MQRLIPWLFAVVLLGGWALPAAAGNTPGSYVYHRFDGVTGLSDVAYDLAIGRSPGDMSKVYWAHQVSWTNGRGGYAGMQTNGGSRHLFLFSVWNATAYRTGSSGSFCQRFSGEGEGVTCRIWNRWVVGHRYRFHYKHEGSGWWGMTVRDLTAGTAFKLGSIQVGASQLAPGSVSWVEYYRWSDPKSTCYSEPHSLAYFYLPTGNNGSRRARVTSTDTACGIMSRVDNAGAYTVHRNAIGNSAMSRTRAYDGSCLDVAYGSGADNTPVSPYPCHSGLHQFWVSGRDNTLRSALFTCLTAVDSTTVRMYACGGGRRQAWIRSEGRLIESVTRRCLTAYADRVALAACNGSQQQKWSVPGRYPN